ncbi:MAG: hypothetical protein U9N44_00795 [Chloroflexota bacterium]|nr:hypothetical protein [Chloroflexota bacterium]
MKAPATIRHNQTTAAALALSLLLLGGFMGCQLLKEPPPEAVAAVAVGAEAAAATAPPPWKEILLAVSALLGSGIFVDNRRKDVVIKVLKTQNGNQKEVSRDSLRRPNSN